MDTHALDLVDDMFDLGVEMRRERARREAPGLDDSAIQAIVTTWIRSRPSSGIEPEVAAAAEMLTVARELRMPVARTGHLIANLRR